MSDTAYDRVVEALRLLPTGSLLAWGDDTSGDGTLLSAPLNVWAPALARPLGLLWVWTILDEECGAEASALLIVVPPDVLTAEHLEGVLADWAAAHAGRFDISFRYDPALQSDLAGRLIRQARIDPRDAEPSYRAPDGTLHGLSPHDAPNGKPLTACGRVIGEGWQRDTVGLLFTPEMSEEDDDAEWARACC